MNKVLISTMVALLMGCSEEVISELDESQTEQNTQTLTSQTNTLVNTEMTTSNQTESDTQLGTTTQTQIEDISETYTESSTDIESSTGTESSTDTEPSTNTVTNSQTQTNTQIDSTTHINTQSETETETETEIIIANAGDDQYVFEKDHVQLSAQHIEPQPNQVIEYFWQQTSGVNVNLDSHSISRPAFDLPYIAVDEYLDFELTLKVDDVFTTDSVRIFVEAVQEELKQEPSVKLIPCSKSGLTDHLVSLHRGEVVDQCFVNQSSADLRTAWIDYNGVNRVWTLILPGEQICNSVESKHLYYVATSLFQCHFYFLPSPDQPELVITDDFLANLPYQHSSAQGVVSGLEGELTLQVDRQEISVTKNGEMDLGQIASVGIARQPENQTCSIESHPGKDTHWIDGKNQVFIDDFTITCTDMCPSRILPSGASLLRDCGPIDNRVGLVFIGDGYTQPEINSTWQPHVDSVSSRMLNEEEPYARYHKFINVYRVDTVSNESGIDDLINDTYVDTALGGKRDTNNTCWLDWRLAHEVIADALGDHPQHWKIMAMNYATCTGRAHTLYGAIYPTLSLINYDVMLHEAGHAFFKLGDEYYSEGTTYSGGYIDYVNLTDTQMTPPWVHWLGYEQPNLDGPIGTYEGGYYKEFGVWRPSSNSLMKDGYHPFDIVAIESAILEIYKHVDPIDSHTDNTQALSARDIIELNVVDSNVIKVRWYLDGKLIDQPESKQLDLSSLNLLQGGYQIQARAYDEILDFNFSDNQNPHPLDLVRKDLDTLEQSVFWDVVVD